MKNLVLLSLFFCSIISAAQELSFSKLDRSPLDVVIHRDTDNEAIARVIYSRPSMRGRKVFGDLVPYDQVWRTGANEATEIAFFKDVRINDRVIPAGYYSIYTIPSSDQWRFILNSQTNQWGTNYDPNKNVIEVSMERIPAPQTIESFSISFLENEDELLLFMGWEETMVSLAITPVKD